MKGTASSAASNAGATANLQRFGFLLVPNFSLIALSSAVDPLRLANMALGYKAFDYVTVGMREDAIASSDGIRVLPDKTIGQSHDFSAVFVVGPNPIPRVGYGETSRWLQKLAAQGVALGGVDTGVYYLAKAGLLKGYRCTVHWEDKDALQQEFPDLLVSSRIVEVDRDRYTCSGGVSPLELMTYLLRRPPGSRELAEQVSDLLVAQQRNPDESQSLPLRYRYANLPGSLLEALEIMETNVEEPLMPGEIADYLKISRRQLERQFREFLGTTPARKYMEIRLAKARLSVLRTNRSMEEIGMSCGFATTTHFIARYKDAYGNTPQSERHAHQRA